MALTDTPDAAQRNRPKNALYVGDLDKDVDEGFLYQIFSKVHSTSNSEHRSFVVRLVQLLQFESVATRSHVAL